MELILAAIGLAAIVTVIFFPFLRGQTTGGGDSATSGYSNRDSRIDPL